MILRRALALVAASSVAFVSACAGGDSRETVVETSVKWVNPDGSEIEGEDEPDGEKLSLIHISEPTRREWLSRMPSSA